MRGLRAQRFLQMMRGAYLAPSATVNCTKLKCKLVTENADTAAMYKAINPEI